MMVTIKQASADSLKIVIRFLEESTPSPGDRD